jgi:hypothetical protein
MKRPLRLMALSALSATALAGCGSSGTGASGASAGMAAWRAAIACARTHGMPDLPDPVVLANGQVTVPAGTPGPTPEVASACAAQLHVILPPVSAPAKVSSPTMHALLRYAGCVRTHGLPRWPDPNSLGVFHVRSADAGTLAAGRLVKKACHSLERPGMSVVITPSGQ